MDNGVLEVLLGPTCAPSFVAGFTSKMTQLLKPNPFNPTPFQLQPFQDGEIKPQILHSIRDGDVYVIQPALPPEINFRALKGLCHAAADASAHRVVAIPLYLLGLRGDRKDEPRISITAKEVIDELEIAMMKATRKHVVFLTPHFTQVGGFLNYATCDIVFPTHVFVPELQGLIPNFTNALTGAADPGAMKVADIYRIALGLSKLAVGLKKRHGADKSKYEDLIGDVRDKIVIVVEDIIDTAGTMCGFIELLFDRGAREIYVCATHGIFAGKAIDRLLDAQKFNLKRVLVTNSINNDAKLSADLFITNLFTIVDIGPMIAEVVFHTHKGLSISEIDGLFSVEKGQE